MLINEAVDAVFWRVATPADIDLAMVKGVSYPRGLIAWAEELGYPGRARAAGAPAGGVRRRIATGRARSSGAWPHRVERSAGESSAG